MSNSSLFTQMHFEAALAKAMEENYFIFAELRVCLYVLLLDAPIMEQLLVILYKCDI